MVTAYGMLAAKEAVRVGVAFGSQFGEHAVGGPGGINIPYVNVPASLAGGLVASILGKAVGGEVGELLNEGGKAARAASIGVIGASYGVQRNQK